MPPAVRNMPPVKGPCRIERSPRSNREAANKPGKGRRGGRPVRNKPEDSMDGTPGKAMRASLSGKATGHWHRTEPENKRGRFSPPSLIVSQSTNQKLKATNNSRVVMLSVDTYETDLGFVSAFTAAPVTIPPLSSATGLVLVKAAVVS